MDLRTMLSLAIKGLRTLTDSASLGDVGCFGIVLKVVNVVSGAVTRSPVIAGTVILGFASGYFFLRQVSMADTKVKKLSVQERVARRGLFVVHALVVGTLVGITIFALAYIEKKKIDAEIDVQTRAEKLALELQLKKTNDITACQSFYNKQLQQVIGAKASFEVVNDTSNMQHVRVYHKSYGEGGTGPTHTATLDPTYSLVMHAGDLSWGGNGGIICAQTNLWDMPRCRTFPHGSRVSIKGLLQTELCEL